MKNILLFLCSLFIGVILLLGYKTLTLKRNNQPVTTSLSKPTQFSLEKAPRDSIRAGILSLSGKVEWQSRTAGTPVSITKPQSIQQGEIITTGENGKVVIKVPAVSLISMSPKTKLNFIQTLPADLVLEQDNGISRYTKTGAVPVSIRSMDLLVTLIDGVSTLSVDMADDSVSVTVEKGSLTAAYNDSQNTSNLTTVNAGDTFVFNDDTLEGSIQ